MQLELMPGRYAIVRLDAAASMPLWLVDVAFVSVTRTDEELSIICDQSCVPDGERAERGWRGLKVEGPIDLSTPGVLASLAAPLAAARVPIFALSTFDTDYLLVRETNLHRACEALSAAGHTIA